MKARIWQLESRLEKLPGYTIDNIQGATPGIVGKVRLKYKEKDKQQRLARWHWDRMYSLPNNIEFHRQVPGYFIKDVTADPLFVNPGTGGTDIGMTDPDP